MADVTNKPLIPQEITRRGDAGQNPSVIAPDGTTYSFDLNSHFKSIDGLENKYIENLEHLRFLDEVLIEKDMKGATISDSESEYVKALGVSAISYEAYKKAKEKILEETREAKKCKKTFALDLKQRKKGDFSITATEVADHNIVDAWENTLHDSSIWDNLKGIKNLQKAIWQPFVKTMKYEIEGTLAYIKSEIENPGTLWYNGGITIPDLDSDGEPESLINLKTAGTAAENTKVTNIKDKLDLEFSLIKKGLKKKLQLPLANSIGMISQAEKDLEEAKINVEFYKQKMDLVINTGKTEEDKEEEIHALRRENKELEKELNKLNNQDIPIEGFFKSPNEIFNFVSAGVAVTLENQRDDILTQIENNKTRIKNLEGELAKSSTEDLLKYWTRRRNELEEKIKIKKIEQDQKILEINKLEVEAAKIKGLQQEIVNIYNQLSILNKKLFSLQISMAFKGKGVNEEILISLNGAQPVYDFKDYEAAEDLKKQIQALKAKLINLKLQLNQAKAAEEKLDDIMKSLVPGVLAKHLYEKALEDKKQIEKMAYEIGATVAQHFHESLCCLIKRLLFGNIFGGRDATKIIEKGTKAQVRIQEDVAKIIKQIEQAEKWMDALVKIFKLMYAKVGIDLTVIYKFLVKLVSPLFEGIICAILGLLKSILDYYESKILAFLKKHVVGKNEQCWPADQIVKIITEDIKQIKKKYQDNVIKLIKTMNIRFQARNKFIFRMGKGGELKRIVDFLESTLLPLSAFIRENLEKVNDLDVQSEADTLKKNLRLYIDSLIVRWLHSKDLDIAYDPATKQYYRIPSLMSQCEKSAPKYSEALVIDDDISGEIPEFPATEDRIRLQLLNDVGGNNLGSQNKILRVSDVSNINEGVSIYLYNGKEIIKLKIKFINKESNLIYLKEEVDSKYYFPANTSFVLQFKKRIS